LSKKILNRSLPRELWFRVRVLEYIKPIRFCIVHLIAWLYFFKVCGCCFSIQLKWHNFFWTLAISWSRFFISVLIFRYNSTIQAPIFPRFRMSFLTSLSHRFLGSRNVAASTRISYKYLNFGPPQSLHMNRLHDDGFLVLLCNYSVITRNIIFSVAQGIPNMCWGQVLTRKLLANFQNK
jgi:hypothetical protein